MKNVSLIKNCYGCGVCATACPKQLIEIVQNKEGFYGPTLIDLSKCTNCGLCVDVCSYAHDDLALQPTLIKSYAAWSRDVVVRRKCSSGGVGFELGRKLIEEGYKVCGVRYNAEKNRAEHYIASTIEELVPSIGSKYIQSYTVDGFRSIDRKQKYLITGTPCQIDSFRRYLRKTKREENFILMDFFCHGVPSKLMWDKYVVWAESQVGKLIYVSWRNKFTGWHDSWAMAIDGMRHGEQVNWHDSYNLLIREKKSFLNSRLSQGDKFYQFFLGNYCLGKACYDKCRFKYDRSSADIRIGDLWGNTYHNNEEGVTAAIAFTDKGERVLTASNCQLIPHPFEVVAEGQMRGKTYCPPIRGLMIRLLRSNLPIESKSFSFLINLNRVFNLLRRAKRKILG